jgi:hypothetical protein
LDQNQQNNEPADGGVHIALGDSKPRSMRTKAVRATTIAPTICPKRRWMMNYNGLSSWRSQFWRGVTMKKRATMISRGHG